MLLCLGLQLHSFFNRLTDENRETELIIDDSLYDRSRSKLVHLVHYKPKNEYLVSDFI
jgi:hypothetical protein